MINFERLMTRLEGLMPYDIDLGSQQELAVLLSDLKNLFASRLEATRESARLGGPLLDFFARTCVQRGWDCITFNYDDTLGEALFAVRNTQVVLSEPYWHPDGGYGFFCRPSDACVREVSVYMDVSSPLLLKLHGSINWRVLRGHARPYSVDAVVHKEKWSPIREPYWGINPPSDDVIEAHLEKEPFIVPPVLTKSSLVEQPILITVWSRAYKVLMNAERVLFLGYSLPLTDMASRFLFREALGGLGPANVRVINLASDDESKKALVRNYRELFESMGDDQFEFGGVLSWLEEFLTDYAEDQPPAG
jgi:hypothetical protein